MLSLFYLVFCISINNIKLLGFGKTGDTTLADAFAKYITNNKPQYPLMVIERSSNRLTGTKKYFLTHKKNQNEVKEELHDKALILSLNREKFISYIWIMRATDKRGKNWYVIDKSVVPSFIKVDKLGLKLAKW